MREDPFVVSQYITGPVGGHVAGRDVNVWSVTWQWYSEQDTASLNEWRDMYRDRYNMARQRILFGPDAKLAWVALAILLLILVLFVVNLAQGWTIPPYVFHGWAVGVTLLLLAVTWRKDYDRQVDFVIKAQSRAEMMRIDAELRARKMVAE